MAIATLAIPALPAARAEIEEFGKLPVTRKVVKPTTNVVGTAQIRGLVEGSFAIVTLE